MTRVDDFKEGKCRFDIQKKFYTRRVRYWNRLTGEIVDAPCLEVFKDRLGEALGNLNLCCVHIHSQLMCTTVYGFFTYGS